MKVAFFSETGNNQKYPRDFPNARTEVAWCLALDASLKVKVAFKNHSCCSESDSLKKSESSQHTNSNSKLNFASSKNQFLWLTSA